MGSEMCIRDSNGIAPLLLLPLLVEALGMAPVLLLLPSPPLSRLAASLIMKAFLGEVKSPLELEA